MGRRRRAVRGIAAATVLVLLGSGCDVFVRSSQGSTGAQAAGSSDSPTLSANGRFVAFTSTAPNLVPGDTNGIPDVFVKDHWTGAIERVSVDAVGSQGNGASTEPDISDDGRYVAFTTEASNLVPGDDNGVRDVVMFDRDIAAPMLVSVDDAGVVGDAASSQPSVSETGRIVAFTSDATNLAPRADNGVSDVFVRDVTAGTTINQSGARARDEVTFEPEPADGASFDPVVWEDGDEVGVTFATEAENIETRCGTQTPGVSDIYLTYVGSVASVVGQTAIDMVDTPATAPTGGYHEPAFLSDGQVYRSNVYGDVVSCMAEPPTLVSAGSGGGPANGISTALDADGNDFEKIVFSSTASDLVADDTNGVADVFLWDEATGQIRLVSRPLGGQADGPSTGGSVSADGRFVAFASDATNLVDDTNDATDVFAYPATTATITGVSPASVAAGAAATVTVTGTGFGPGATLSLGSGVTVQSVTVVDETQIQASVTVAAGAAPGPRTVRAGFPPGGSASCTDCISMVPSVPTLAIGDAVATEGTGGSTIVPVTVSLAPTSGATVTVRYATTDGTAVFLPIAERDYASASGTLTFSAGQASKTLNLVVAGDTRPEPDETFTLTLSSPVPDATPIADATATVTLVDDD